MGKLYLFFFYFGVGLKTFRLTTVKSLFAVIINIFVNVFSARWKFCWWVGEGIDRRHGGKKVINIRFQPVYTATIRVLILCIFKEKCFWLDHFSRSLGHFSYWFFPFYSPITSLAIKLLVKKLVELIVIQELIQSLQVCWVILVLMIFTSCRRRIWYRKKKGTWKFLSTFGYDSVNILH